MLQLLSENSLTILKTVEYMEAHDKLKCIGHPLPRYGADCFGQETSVNPNPKLTPITKNASMKPTASVADIFRLMRETERLAGCTLLLSAKQI